MQVRLPLGIEQYELDGRPDGERPFGKESALQEYEDRLEQAINEEAPFKLTEDDFALLQNEGVLYYYRYLVLFQKSDYSRTVRDTDHNLAISKMVEEYFDNEDKKQLLQYKPYILRINSISRAMIALESGESELAKEYIHSTITAILEMPKVNTPVFEFEKIRSIQQLQEILKQLQQHHPDPKEKLEAELRRAVEDENYEQAAKLRDQIRDLTRQNLNLNPDRSGINRAPDMGFDPQNLDALTGSVFGGTPDDDPEESESTDEQEDDEVER